MNISEATPSLYNMASEYIKGFGELRCGLLGEKLSHSFSPQIHKRLADYSYVLCEVESNKLGDWVKRAELIAYNVTIPYKQEIMKYLSELSPAAEKIGAVNTVIRRTDGTLYGDNTDYYGFSYMLDSLRIDLMGKKALVLGSGGASKTVVTVLCERGAEVVVVSRGGENNYSNIEKHSDAVLVVNATPVGMYPNVEAELIDLSVFRELRGVLDLIYNPAHTKLLLQAETMGIPSLCGLSMLVAQAKRACELFTSSEISDTAIENVCSEIEFETQNVVLVGMPGCGKSSVGRAVADTLGRPFVDCDEEIKRRTGRSPSEIITEDSQERFRQIETDVLRDLCKMSGYVIATGGGAVTREVNRDVIRCNGKVIFLERDISKLARDDRPLSVDLPKLYEKRLPLYISFSDAQVDGNTDVKTASDRVIKAFSEIVL